MRRTAVINVVGLAESLLGPDTPRINTFSQRGAKARIRPAFPAVTCTAQTTYLTGANPSEHGIVANGWYNRELAEVQFWKQSNHLVQGKKLWEELRERDEKFTCAKLFWWFNMFSTADYSITPRPIYPADGRKVFDIYTWPASVHKEIKTDLGEFPFATFWGPAAGVKTPQGGPDAASRWIADAAKWIENKYQPTLSLIYLPHLDYNLQRFGPGVNHHRSAVKSDLHAIDSIVGDLIEFFEQKQIQTVLLSEYGITPVETAIHPNRLFRREGLLSIKDELGLEVLNCGASRAFAIVDHQVAHIYLNDPSLENKVRGILESQPGIEHVLDKKAKQAWGIDHPRAGDLIAVARDNAWFTYYYWLDDKVAPDFARTVDIHRKPGYDPVELFLDPAIKNPALKIGFRLLQKKMGFRMLIDVVPLDAGLVKGSHGCIPREPSYYPLVISPRADLIPKTSVEARDIFHILKLHCSAVK